MEQYHWPGNVRELQSVIREALIVSAGPTILPDFLAAELHQEPVAEGDNDETGPVPDVDWQVLQQFVETALADGETDIYRRAREHLDRLLIYRVMRQTGGNQYRAAEILGLSRVTLRAKLRAMQLTIEKTLAPRDSEQAASSSATEPPVG